MTSKLASFYSKKIPLCLDYVMCCITRTAIRLGLKSLTEFMLKNGSKEVTMANPDLIILAAGCNEKDIVQMLLQKGFDINTQDETQLSSIYLATLRGQRSSGSIYTFMDIQIFQQNHVSTYTFFNILKFNMQIFQNTSIRHANI